MNINTIAEAVGPQPFVVETIYGPYVCRWTQVNGLYACVFIQPFNPGTAAESVPSIPPSAPVMDGAAAAVEDRA